MKKIALLAAMTVVVSATSILTQDRERQERFEDRAEHFEDRLEDNGFFFDQNGFFNGTRLDTNRFDENDFVNVAGISQQFDQDTESGDVDQPFMVSGAGGNSDQCVGISGVTNTGKAQNSTSSIQYASDIEDFEQGDIGSDLMADGSSTVSCEQQVNQAAAAG